MQGFVIAVYGTLLSDAAMHEKYIGQFLRERKASFLGTALTVDEYTLALKKPRNNVCLFKGQKQAKRIFVEAYSVTEDVKNGIDTFEKVAKGHYNEEIVDIEMFNQPDKPIMQAGLYVKPNKHWSEDEFSLFGFPSYNKQVRATFPYTLLVEDSK